MLKWLVGTLSHCSTNKKTVVTETIACRFKNSSKSSNITILPFVVKKLKLDSKIATIKAAQLSLLKHYTVY